MTAQTTSSTAAAAGAGGADARPCREWQRDGNVLCTYVPHEEHGRVRQYQAVVHGPDADAVAAEIHAALSSPSGGGGAAGERIALRLEAHVAWADDLLPKSARDDLNAIASDIRRLVAAPPRTEPAGGSDLLARFRDFVIINATAWKPEGSHHNPIWQEVADAVATRSDPAGGDETFPRGAGTGTYFRRLPNGTWNYLNHADQWQGCATPTWVRPVEADDLVAFARQDCAIRLRMRLDAMEERGAETVGIGKSFARDILYALDTAEGGGGPRAPGLAEQARPRAKGASNARSGAPKGDGSIARAEGDVPIPAQGGRGLADIVGHLQDAVAEWPENQMVHIGFLAGHWRVLLAALRAAESGRAGDQGEPLRDGLLPDGHAPAGHEPAACDPSRGPADADSLPEHWPDVLRSRAKWGRGSAFTLARDSEGTCDLLDRTAAWLEADRARRRVGDFQARNATWMAEAFAGDPTDLHERRDRADEEHLELSQALGGTAEGWHRLVDYTFGRPIGEPVQELGGTLTTLACLAVVAGLDMAGAGERELARCSMPEVIAKIRRKRSNRHGRGVLPGNDADLSTRAASGIEAAAAAGTQGGPAEGESPAPSGGCPDPLPHLPAQGDQGEEGL